MFSSQICGRFANRRRDTRTQDNRSNNGHHETGYELSDMASSSASASSNCSMSSTTTSGFPIEHLQRPRASFVLDQTLNHAEPLPRRIPCAEPATTKLETEPGLATGEGAYGHDSFDEHGDYEGNSIDLNFGYPLCRFVKPFYERELSVGGMHFCTGRTIDDVITNHFAQYRDGDSINTDCIRLPEKDETVIHACRNPGWHGPLAIRTRSKIDTTELRQLKQTW